MRDQAFDVQLDEPVIGDCVDVGPIVRVELRHFGSVGEFVIVRDDDRAAAEWRRRLGGGDQHEHASAEARGKINAALAAKLHEFHDACLQWIGVRTIA